jgi:hypothetical protein
MKSDSIWFTNSSKHRASVKPVDDEDPALHVHDDVGQGKVDHQLVARCTDILIPKQNKTRFGFIALH